MADEKRKPGRPRANNKRLRMVITVNEHAEKLLYSEFASLPPRARARRLIVLLSIGLSLEKNIAGAALDGAIHNGAAHPENEKMSAQVFENQVKNTELPSERRIDQADLEEVFGSFE